MDAERLSPWWLVRVAGSRFCVNRKNRGATFFANASTHFDVVLDGYAVDHSCCCFQFVVLERVFPEPYS